MPDNSRSVSLRYGVAVAAIIVSTLLKFGLDPLIPNTSPYLISLTAVMISAWFGGLGPGLLATALAAITSDIFFETPNLVWGSVTSAQIVHLGIFLIEGGLISVLSGTLHSARLRAEWKAGEARRHEERYRNLVETAPDAIVLLDSDFTIMMANQGAARMNEYASPDEMVGLSVLELFDPDDRNRALVTAQMILDAPLNHGVECSLRTRTGRVYPAEVRATAIRNPDGSPLGFIALASDIGARKAIEKSLREQSETLETLNRVGGLLSAELDQKRLLQALTDAATGLSGARFGSFFYNVVDDRGESYMLYTLSGVPAETFAHFPMPRNTDIFGPTFKGDGVIRLDDVKLDPRYGRNSPYYGMPEGHLPVTSYLAVPVISRSGEVLGGLFFGHPLPGVFTERIERLIVGLAAQAAIALDNARLFEAASADRAKAEASEERYRVLTEVMPSLVWTADGEGNVDFLNQRWYDYTGQIPEQGAGWGWRDVLHPDDVAAAMARWRLSIERGELYETEYRIRRASDGVYRWHIGRGIPLRYKDGSVRWFGICTDIDDQKRAQDALRFLAEASTVLGSSLEYRETLRTVAEMAVAHVADWCIIDLAEDDGSVVRTAVAHADPAAAALAAQVWGAGPSSSDERDPIGGVLANGVPEFYFDVDGHAAGSASATRFPELDRSMGLRSGMTLPMLIRGRALGAISLFLVGDGRRYGEEDIALAQDLARRAAIAIDSARLYGAAQEEIAERRRAEVELREAKEQAEEANRAKDHFLAVLSHELRTPLTPVLASVQALQTEDGVPGDLLPLLDIIHRNVELEARLIDDLLDLTRIERGKLQLNNEVVDVDALLKNVLDICAPEIAAKRLMVTIDARAARHHVFGDSARLQQVFWNLVKNAVKFTPEGGRVAIASNDRPDGGISVSVADTGIGIAPDFLPRIFNAFEQGERTINRRFGGLGLGLAISRTLVDLHGGRLTAASDGDGHGATFTVDLPTVPRIDSPGRDGEETAGAGRSGRGVRVLLVEDHTDTRNVMRMFLEQRGYDVRVADGVRSALTAADEPFDLLISDIGLPDGSGLDLIRALRARGPVKGIALSGFGMEEDLQRSREAGFMRHLTKPVNGATLQEVIESLVDGEDRGA